MEVRIASFHDGVRIMPCDKLPKAAVAQQSSGFITFYIYWFLVGGVILAGEGDDRSSIMQA